MERPPSRAGPDDYGWPAPAEHWEPGANGARNAHAGGAGGPCAKGHTRWPGGLLASMPWQHAVASARQSLCQPC